MKIAVLKLSGKALNDIFTNQNWIASLIEIKNSFDGLIIVHGAGQNISEWSQALGHEVKFFEGQRVTTKETMEVVAAVQAGVLNTKIVSRLQSNGIDATGLSGVDRGAFVAEYKSEALGFVGIPKRIGSIAWITDLLKSGVVPVFSSVCRDSAGNLMNVNADVFTEVIATAVKAESVFFVSDIQGVKLNGEIKETINEKEIKNGIAAGEITDGMIPKLNSCVGLLDKGINKVWIGSNNLCSMFNKQEYNNYRGTWIVQSA
jgi:acetylglutamate kinase